jgi:hypothetical protein
MILVDQPLPSRLPDGLADAGVLPAIDPETVTRPGA